MAGAVLLVIGGLVASLAAATSALTVPTTNLASAIPIPAGVLTPSFQSISCTGVGECTAVGSYVMNRQLVGMAASETHGVWAPALTLGTPDADSSTLSSVSCVTAGNCTAVGDDTTVQNYREPIAVTEIAGHWGVAIPLQLPTNSSQPPFDLLRSVSCTTPKDCTAVGEYLDTSARELPVVVREQAGSWGAPMSLEAPFGALQGGAGSAASFTSVSCVTPSDCTAVGDYTAASGAREAMAASSTKAGWEAAVAISEPRSLASAASGELTAVSCASIGNCTAVGDALNSLGGYSPAEVTERLGRWRPVVEVQVPPTDAGNVPAGELVSVSCTHQGICTTVGSYLDGSDNSEPLIAVATGGAWGPGFGASVPSGGTRAGSALTGVSCVIARCMAIGNYAASASLGRQMALAIRL